MTGSADPRYEAAIFPPFLLETLAQVAAKRGADPEALCRGLGFGADDLRDPALRVSWRQAVSMIQRALKQLPGADLGLAVGGLNVLGTLGLLGHAVSVSRTLRDAIGLGLRYQHLSGGITTSTAHEQGEHAWIEVECRVPDAAVQVFAIDEYCASFVVYARSLGGAGMPLKFELMHARPANPSAYARTLGAHVTFGCPHNRVLLPRALLDTELPGHQPVALRQAMQLLEAEGARAGVRHDLAEAVERAIARSLTDGAQVEAIARALNMSGRTLRRRLAGQGLSFDALLENVRRARVVSLLMNPELPIDRVAAGAGYSDARSFRRAFKRWTGVVPSEYRRE